MKMNDKVKIKSSGVTGVIVDINHLDGKSSFTVESDEMDEANGIVLYDCSEEELEYLK